MIKLVARLSIGNSITNLPLSGEGVHGFGKVSFSYLHA